MKIITEGNRDAADTLWAGWCSLCGATFTAAGREIMSNVTYIGGKATAKVVCPCCRHKDKTGNMTRIKE